MKDSPTDQIIEGALKADGLRFVIVASRWNDLIVSRLISGARDALLRLGAQRDNLTLVRVPGSFEIPLAARKLAERFGGDPGAADWRHFGRLAGFTNRKRAYRDAETGLHPFVKLIEAPGTVYAEAGQFLSEVRAGVEAEQHLPDLQERLCDRNINAANPCDDGEGQ